MASSPPSAAPNCCVRCCTGLISLGFVVFVYWLIFQPHQIRAYVDAATLSRFSLSDSDAAAAPSLSYNLTVALSLRNPNRRIGIYYDRLSAAAFYAGAQLGPADWRFEPFFQHPKSTAAVMAAFEGRESGVSEEVRDAFGGERSAGAYRLEVRLDARLRYKLWFLKVHGFKPRAHCSLSFAFAPNGTASPSLMPPAPAKCRVRY